MNRHEADTLIAAIKGLMSDKPEVVATGPTGAKLVRPEPATRADDAWLGNKPTHEKEWSADFEEKLYQRFKARLIDECRVDPILLELLTNRPEIVIDVEPRVMSLDGSSLRGRLARLMASGFFATAKTQSACRAELRRTGTDVNSGQLSTSVNDFVKDGFLTRDGDGYVLAAGIKITEREVVAR